MEAPRFGKLRLTPILSLRTCIERILTTVSLDVSTVFVVIVPGFFGRQLVIDTHPTPYTHPHSYLS